MESEGEIEYLDEDEEIVQQCVQTAPVANPLSINASSLRDEKLLVERNASEKKRKRRRDQEEDSDYDPNEDLGTVSPDDLGMSPKRKKAPPKKVARLSFKPTIRIPIKPAKDIPKAIDTHIVIQQPTPVIDLKTRKKMKIKIPDFEDPLCLPVRAFSGVKSELLRLKNWNNMCLEHMKHSGSVLKPEEGRTVKSTRTIVLRNVVHKETGKSEKAVWSKTSVENEHGVKRSEIFQSILPKYREKKQLKPYILHQEKKPRRFHHVNEVILTKEKYKEDEVLVAYKPKEFLCAVYKADNLGLTDKADDSDEKMTMTEVALCKSCAPCYQASWRGARNSTKNLKCPICNHSSGSVYNLITHLKTHSDADVRKYKKIISAMLAKAVGYHYKCRICQLQCVTIAALRRHVTTHAGTEPFKCEVCFKTVR